jgi:hypothetical protein
MEPSRIAIRIKIRMQIDEVNSKIALFYLLPLIRLIKRKKIIDIVALKLILLACQPVSHRLNLDKLSTDAPINYSKPVRSALPAYARTN